MRSKRYKAYSILLLVTLIWAAAGSVIKHTLAELPPFTFLTYRFAISGLIASVFLLSGKVKLPKNKTVLFMLAANAVIGNTLALGLLFWGLTKTTVLDTSIIEATLPIVAAVMGYKLLGEHITKKEKLGVVIAFLGTLLTVVGPLLEERLLAEPLSFDRLIGNFVIFIFVVCDGFAFIIGKKLLRRHVSAYAISHVSFIVAFVTMLPVAVYFEGVQNIIPEITSLSLSGHLGVFFMAVISGTLAYALWNLGQKTIEVSEAAVFRYLIPVFSAPIAIGWLGERLSLHFVAGALVIGIGVFIAEYKGKLTTHNLHLLGHRK